MSAGGLERIRTSDPLNVNEVLYHWATSPVKPLIDTNYTKKLQ